MEEFIDTKMTDIKREMEPELRVAELRRKTSETDIHIKFNIDGIGDCGKISSGIGFFDHMLSGFARHGLFDFELELKGDLEVDSHHSVEDCGIVLGEAIYKALGEKKGIRRFGSMILPMDETLVLCALDLSGRPYLAFEADFSAPMLGGLQTEMVREFFYAVSYSAKMNLHIKKLNSGESNDHHLVEACFKAFGKALDEATRYEDRLKNLNTVWSTKGSL